MTLIQTIAASDEIRPGFTLPQRFYTHPDIFALDMDVFFHKSWMLGGFEADIPDEGDVHSIEIGSASILLVRDDDGQVRAFHNVCRHRGARLVEGSARGISRLVCPYHQWSYDLEGNLVHAAHMGQDFDKGCHGLKDVHARAVGGMIFVCLAEEPPADFDDVADELEERLRPFDLGNAKIAMDCSIMEQGNWKLSIDNNRECYHCEGSHPELTHTFVGLDVGFDPADITPGELANYERHCETAARQIAAWESQGFRSGPVEWYTGHETMLRTQRLVIAGPGESHTMNGKAAVGKLFGGLTDPRLGDLHIHVMNGWHHVFADHAVFSLIIPVSPTQTLLRTVWLVHPDAREGIDYDLERLTEVWSATNAQDAELVEVAQKGVASPAYEPGPLSAFTEKTVKMNLDWYAERLRAHGY